MRQDARSLLEKLQQTDFVYHDFEEQEDEGEPWPLLDALLRHPAIARTAPVRSWPQRGPVEVDLGESKPVSRLFRRYDNRPEEPAPSAKPQPEPPSLRSFLNKLGDED
ncbi:hypothetical protein [Flavisphingomonas formosensis]|uniref:hypothetical protein n=1 Tax=Flavisphingomonas formosensis TaxID=861534 RepID=UPI0012FAEE58|nr:hypothetical protein [Sphingomonas formosensis]